MVLSYHSLLRFGDTEHLDTDSYFLESAEFPLNPCFSIALRCVSFDIDSRFDQFVALSPYVLGIGYKSLDHKVSMIELQDQSPSHWN